MSLTRPFTKQTTAGAHRNCWGSNKYKYKYKYKYTVIVFFLSQYFLGSFLAPGQDLTTCINDPTFYRAVTALSTFPLIHDVSMTYCRFKASKLPIRSIFPQSFLTLQPRNPKKERSTILFVFA